MANASHRKDHSRNRSIPNHQAPPKRVQLVYLATKYRRAGVVSIIAMLWFSAIAVRPEISEQVISANNQGAAWLVHLQFASLICAYLIVTKLIDRQLGSTYRVKTLLRFYQKNPEFIKHLERCLLRDECPQLWREGDQDSPKEKYGTNQIRLLIKPLLE